MFMFRSILPRPSPFGKGIGTMLPAATHATPPHA